MALPDQYIGYFSDYQTGSSSVRVQSISCPSDAENIVQCQYGTSTGCSSFEEVLTCIDREFILSCMLYLEHNAVHLLKKCPS